MSNNITQSTNNWEQVRADAIALFEPDIADYILECAKKPRPHSQLIAVLHKIQGRYGYLSTEHMDATAQLLGVPSSTVTGVATFYHFFRLKPVGRHKISVCMGTACYVKGSQNIIDKFCELLKIRPGETTPDGLFTVDALRCIGACAIAPAVTINGKVYANLTVDRVEKIIKEYEGGAN